MFPCGICLLTHLNTLKRIRLPKTVCSSCREGDLKGRIRWGIMGAFESWEAEILPYPGIESHEQQGKAISFSTEFKGLIWRESNFLNYLTEVQREAVVKNTWVNTGTINRLTMTGSIWSRVMKASGPTIGCLCLESGGQIICSLLLYLALFKLWKQLTPLDSIT